MSLNLDRLVTNNTGYIARPFHQRDRHGHDVITVVTKLSWGLDLDGTATRLNPQRGIRPSAEYCSEDGYGSIRFPADQPPEKPGTDVIMLASAYPPEGAPVASHDISLTVHRHSGPLSKTIRAFGPRPFLRQGDKLVPGDAGPLSPTPIRYELAAGGVDREVFEAVRQGHVSREELQAIEGRIYDPVNPSGRGCAADLSRLEGTPAYQFEPLEGTAPAGFGAVDSHWEARSSYGGTRDQAYFERRHPIAPTDLDPRYFCYAHPDLWSAEPLTGDERVEVVGAVPEQTFGFSLPVRKPRFDVRAFGQEEQLQTHLDTFLLDLEQPGHRVVELVWRVSVRLPRKSERLEWIRITEDEVPTEAAA